MRRLLLPLLSLPLLAQAPPKGSKAFFLQDPKVVIAACAEESMALERDRDDGRTNAEWARAFVAAGLRDKAEALFSRARPLLAPTTHSLLEATGWLRTGHPGEGMGLLLAEPFRSGSGKEHFKAARELLLAGCPEPADALMKRGRELDPGEVDLLLECAEAAGEAGASEQALRYATWAADAALGKPGPLAIAGRIACEALHPRALPVRTAPWARGPQPPAAPATRKAFMISRVPFVFGPQSSVLYGTGESRFAKAEPDRERFGRALVADMGQALGDRHVMAPPGDLQDLPALLAQVKDQMSPEDRLLALEEVYLGLDEVSRWGRSEGFLLTRLRLAAFDRTGARVRSHTFTLVTSINEVPEALTLARKYLREFLAGPAYKHWIE